MSNRLARAYSSRRSIVKQGAVIGGVGLLGSSGAALGQGATPAASPAASAPVSVVAERASGEIRLAGASDAIGQEITEASSTVSPPNTRTSPSISRTIPPSGLDQIQTDIAAGNAADVFFVQNEYAQDFMSRGCAWSRSTITWLRTA